MPKTPVLTIVAESAFLPVAVSFVKKTCQGYGFSQKETTALVLAAEEIFVYLNKLNPGTMISISCRSKPYLMELTLEFTAENFNLRAFNLTSTVDVEYESSLEELGLLIAGRMVDSFSINQTGGKIHMSLMKYMGYKEAAATGYTPGPMVSRTIDRPDPLEVRMVAGMIHESESMADLPFFFKTPLMVADMHEAGDLAALILKDRQNTIAGGLFWKSLNRNTAEILGPYIYGQTGASQMGEELVEKCLEAIGKENFTGVICRHYGHDLPEQYFETIGTLSGKKIFFRQLQEDTGTCAWLHPSIAADIADRYERLFLPRNIIAPADDVRPRTPYTVISSEVNRAADTVVMHPLVLGQDVLETVAAHCLLFQSDGYQTILFTLDLGNSAHAGWIPALTENGFTTALLVPYGGKGDLLTLAYHHPNRGGK